jgi:hypothetical protein
MRYFSEKQCTRRCCGATILETLSLVALISLSCVGVVRKSIAPLIYNFAAASAALDGGGSNGTMPADFSKPNTAVATDDSNASKPTGPGAADAPHGTGDPNAPNSR